MSEPVMVKVPIGDGTEVGLMLAMDTIVQMFLLRPAGLASLNAAEVRRAVEWLHTRYVRDMEQPHDD